MGLQGQWQCRYNTAIGAELQSTQHDTLAVAHTADSTAQHEDSRGDSMKDRLVETTGTVSGET